MLRGYIAYALEWPQYLYDYAAKISDMVDPPWLVLGFPYKDSDP